LDNFDLLLFTEHWTRHDLIELICIDKFKLVSHFSRSNHTHGGTVIYAKNDLTIKNRPDIVHLSAELDCEIAAVEIVNLNTIYCCIYRSPNGNLDIFIDKMNSLLQIIAQEVKYCFLIGDFNFDNLIKSKELNELNDLFLSYDCENIIKEATRVQGNSATCIDLCYTNTKNSSVTLNKNRVTDHYGLEIIHNTVKFYNEPVCYPRRILLNSNLKGKLMKIMETETWSDLDNATDTDEMYLCFHRKLLTYIDQVVPVKTQKPKCKDKSVSDSTTSEIVEEIKLY
jgi:hypothetical protein